MAKPVENYDAFSFALSFTSHQAAKTRQQIKEEEMQILLLERTQQIKVEELENLRQEHHLDATVRKPAEAERFRLERLAEADRLRLTAEAEAEAESIRLKGLAEAEALQIVAQSEAEQMMRKAEAWKAYKAAKTRQQIKEEEMQILLLERTQQIKVEELENLRQEHHLDATVRKPAEAERFRLERLAEADRLRLTAEAEAEAESIRLKGLAEAEALQIVAQSEAEQMMRKAEAWKAYKGAARLDMVLQMLPKLAAEISAPLAQCDKVTMVTTGDGEIGISKLTGEVLTLMSRLPSVIQTMTGVDVTKAMQSV
ncbi:hypothetical protein AHF37_07983 [Paragonimus kellicotti]|nr:hypothetical protein AHF37_07983 [Paragonimus kellicotti]